MQKVTTVKALALAGVLAWSAVMLLSQSVDAADFIDLDFENAPIVFGLGVGVLPDDVGSDEYTFGVAHFVRYTFEGQERYVQLLANELIEEDCCTDTGDTLEKEGQSLKTTLPSCLIW